MWNHRWNQSFVGLCWLVESRGRLDDDTAVTHINTTKIIKPTRSPTPGAGGYSNMRGEYAMSMSRFRRAVIVASPHIVVLLILLLILLLLLCDSPPTYHRVAHSIISTNQPAKLLLRRVLLFAQAEGRRSINRRFVDLLRADRVTLQQSGHNNSSSTLVRVARIAKQRPLVSDGLRAAGFSTRRAANSFSLLTFMKNLPKGRVCFGLRATSAALQPNLTPRREER